MDSDEGAPRAGWQDDVRAREALLAFLEDRLPLDEAVAQYVEALPPEALSVEDVRARWKAWNRATRALLAQQIRRSMKQEGA